LQRRPRLTQGCSAEEEEEEEEESYFIGVPWLVLFFPVTTLYTDHNPLFPTASPVSVCSQVMWDLWWTK
jgi:hypothetical protein